MVHLHVIDELRTGGAQTHLVTTLRAAAKFPEIQHHALSLFGDGEIGASLRALGVRVQALDLRPELENRNFRKAIEKLRRAIRDSRPDLIEAHLTWSRLLALYAAWRESVPLRIAFEHGDLYMDSWKFRLANFATQVFARNVVVCSNALADLDHRKHGIARSRLRVLHNCVDVHLFTPVGPKAPGVEFPAGTTVFCAVGTLGKGVNKRVDVCIRATAAARASGGNVGLVICGDGELRSELEDLAHSLGMAQHVRFLGMRSDIPAVLRCCHAFCHAAPFEPFGIVALEAMACALPVVVPDSGGIREIVTPGRDGLLYPALDHRALANIMCELAENPARRKELGDTGRTAVEQNYSAKAYVERLYRCYGIPMYAARSEA